MTELSSPNSQDQLTKEVTRLALAMEKANSLGRALLLGMVRGLGMAIGATIITAAVLALFWRVISTTGFGERLQSFNVGIPQLPSGGLEQLEQLRQGQQLLPPR